MVLEIIVSKPCAFAGIDVSEYADEIQQALDNGHTPISIEYFHGVLEDIVGYDIGVCLNGEQCINLEKQEYIEGIYDAKVVGYANLCKAYLWNVNGRHKGLIVDSTSNEDVCLAELKYNNKECFL